MKVDQFLPEEGVMLNADLPQPLGSSVVGKLKTDSAFKLLVLEGGDNREKCEENVSTAECEVPLFCWRPPQYFTVDHSLGQPDTFIKNAVKILNLIPA